MARTTRDIIEDLLATYDERLRTAFLTAVDDIRSAIVLRVVVERLERGDVAGAIEAMHLDVDAFARLELAIVEAYNAGGAATVENLPRVTDPQGNHVVLRFGIRNPEAEAWLMDEVDPRNAVYLLPDFERVLGPDPCGRDLGAQTLAQRQRLAHQRWTARGGPSIPYFVELAARLGVEIQIEEFWPSKANVLRAGQPLVPEGAWRVRLPLISQWIFRASANTAGEPLGGYALNDAECELRRLKPAHTLVVFAYVEN